MTAQTHVAATALLGTTVVLLISLTLSLRLLRHTKYRHAPSVAPLSIGDVVFAALLAIGCSLAAAQSLWLGFAVASLALFVLLVLWLDAALYGCFTFELGLHGVRDVVLSNLLAEIFEVRWARRFFAREIFFTILPLLFLLQLITPLFPTGGRAWGLAQGLVFSCLLLALLTEPAVAKSDEENTTGPVMTRPPLGSKNAEAPRAALAIDLVRPRRPQVCADFSPRPPHKWLLDPIRLPQRSPEFGMLPRASIVLFTFESLGRHHVADAQAKLPFLSRIAAAPDTHASTFHVSPAPLTNAAHIALYFSQAALTRPLAGRPHLDVLSRAGYQTIYLTAANTAHYGLQAILSRAGFQHVIDARQLADAPAVHAGQRLPAAATDLLLCSRGLVNLRALLAQHRGPVFLHVHAQNAHIPYRIEDRQRFADRDLTEDRTRFLCAQEETDAIFARLHASILQLLSDQSEPARAPIFVLSSDHGQSFGEHGYFSHGSAVTVEQTAVPLYLQHPQLGRRQAAFSSHYDVLPTLLDWVGLPVETGRGQPLSLPVQRAGLLLHDGQPSRPTSSCLGLLVDHEKYALDLVRGTLLRSDWHDQHPVLITGDDRRYFETLIAQLSMQQGIL